MPTCAKPISSRVRKVLGIAKTLLFLGALWYTTVSMVFMADVSLLSILKTGNWARLSTPASYYFYTYITTIYQHQDLVQDTVLGLSSHFGSNIELCKILQICWAIRWQHPVSYWFSLYTLFSCLKNIVQSCGYVGLLGLILQSSSLNCLTLSYKESWGTLYFFVLSRASYL